MNILVTGANGQLGSEIRANASTFKDYNLFFTDLPELDLTQFQSICDFIQNNNIETIINCAAYTAVDKAETEREKAYAVNVIGATHLARAAREFDAALVHISTDYVFSGEKNQPYTETDIPNPVNYYGLTKLEGELAVKGSGARSLIIRTSWLYSSFGQNFVKTILRLAAGNASIRIVADQFGTPTYAADLACAILSILSKPIDTCGELYHYSNLGSASWFEFAQEIVTLRELPCDVIPITTNDYPLPARRASYSIMDTTKIIQSFHLEIPIWQHSLAKCLERISS